MAIDRDEERERRLARLEAARRASLKFRDRHFPGAGLMRAEGGVFSVLERALRENRSWL